MISIAPGQKTGTAEAKAGSYLGGPAFANFREALARAKGKWNGSVNVLPVERVGAFVAALEEYGFDFVLDPSLRPKPTYDASQLDASRKRLAEASVRAAAAGKPVRDYQRIGVEAVAPRRKYAQFDDMGLGKTMQLLVAINDPIRAVWVCPASLKLNVAIEAKLWRPEAKVTVLSGLGSFKVPDEGEIIVLNYDILPGEVKPITEKKNSRKIAIGVPTFEVPVQLIADEAHLLKNAKSIRSILFRKLRENIMKADGSVWVATGTPKKNRPPELWNVLEAADLAHEAFGSWDRFVSLYRGSNNLFGYSWGDPKPEVAECLRRVSIKRMKRDVLTELPPKQYQQIIVPIDTKTKNLCDEVVTHLKSKGVDINAIEDALLITKLGGATFDLISRAMMSLTAAKTGAALDIVESYEENEEPLVVVAEHRAPIDILQKRKGWAAIHGDTKVTDRQAYVDAFQSGKLNGIAGTIKAIGVGVTLTHASHMLRISRGWTPADNQQVEDRINRLGQTADSLLIIDLIADHPLDVRLTELLVVKEKLIKMSVEASAILPDERPEVPQEQFKIPELPQEFRRIGGRNVPVPTSKTRRPAASALERWAQNGLTKIAQADSDHAAVVNGVGFSKLDNTFAHSIVRQFPELSELQWQSAVRLARKYRRQIGEEPSEVSA